MKPYLVFAVVLAAASVVAVACDSKSPGTHDGDASNDETMQCTCSHDQVCVQYFDGDCSGGMPVCITTTCSSCSSEECEQILCPSPYQCNGNAPMCGTEVQGAIFCYGP